MFNSCHVHRSSGAIPVINFDSTAFHSEFRANSAVADTQDSHGVKA
jgi:hypothetical protein